MNQVHWSKQFASFAWWADSSVATPFHRLSGTTNKSRDWNRPALASIQILRARMLYARKRMEKPGDKGARQTALMKA
jgi:hypothetical protein